ncbi:anti-sigma factor domain-containing protein [Deinococcus actinosclerus]|uniref:anti-sigma factor n=1 Tax=Deinococcus actinosclerus TaxID=1768108 RepID=UPI000A7A977D|nr:anti-sigma factor [Deinococcus actinosclerus]
MISREDILALALGQLAPDDEQRVRAAIEADPALAREYHADLELLHGLPDSLPEAEVPAGAEARLIERLRREEAAVTSAPANIPLHPPATVPSARPARPMNWRLMLLAVVAAVTLGVIFLRPPATQDLLSEYQTAPGAQSQPLTAGGQAIGELIRLPDGRAYLHLNALAPQDRVYQLWRIEDGKPVSAGLFDGQGVVLPRVQAGQTVAVSVEPAGGSEQPTTTPILIQQL